jgi:hypothetical protein
MGSATFWAIALRTHLVTLLRAKLGHNFDPIQRCSLYNYLRIRASPGANPTIASYNASVVKIYSAVNNMGRF